MHTTVDYSKSPAPAFDAVNDVMNWFGDRWPSVTELMSRVKDPSDFRFYAAFSGVQGAPVRYWYDHYHGQGAFDKALEATKCATCGGTGEVFASQPMYDAEAKVQYDDGDFVGCEDCNGRGHRRL